MSFQFRPRPQHQQRMDNIAYDDVDSTDSEHTITRAQNQFLFPPSVSSTASSTPVPSRSTSPLPQLYPHPQSSSCPSDSDSEPSSPLVLHHRRPQWDRERRPWWAGSAPRRPHRRWRAVRLTKRSLRRLLRHPFFPGQPITIVSVPPLSRTARYDAAPRSSPLFYFPSLPYPSPCFLSIFSTRTRNHYPGVLIALSPLSHPRLTVLRPLTHPMSIPTSPMAK